MVRDILSEFGNDSGAGQKPSATKGGETTARDVRDYKPPQGPSNINDPKGPGLHGDNYGNCGSQGPSGATARERGRPGLGGENKTNKGSQR